MKRKLMICAMALCICAGLTGNTGEVSVWASEESSSDAVRIGALKGPTAMGMAQLLGVRGANSHSAHTGSIQSSTDR